MNDEDRDLADVHDFDAAVSFIAALICAAGGLTILVGGRIGGLALLAVGAMLLAVANWSWHRADEARQ